MVQWESYFVWGTWEQSWNGVAGCGGILDVCTWLPPHQHTHIHVHVLHLDLHPHCSTCTYTCIHVYSTDIHVRISYTCTHVPASTIFIDKLFWCCSLICLCTVADHSIDPKKLFYMYIKLIVAISVCAYMYMYMYLWVSTCTYIVCWTILLFVLAFGRQLVLTYIVVCVCVYVYVCVYGDVHVLVHVRRYMCWLEKGRNEMMR